MHHDIVFDTEAIEIVPHGCSYKVITKKQIRLQNHGPQQFTLPIQIYSKQCAFGFYTSNKSQIQFGSNKNSYLTIKNPKSNIRMGQQLGYLIFYHLPQQMIDQEIKPPKPPRPSVGSNKYSIKHNQKYITFDGEKFQFHQYTKPIVIVHDGSVFADSVTGQHQIQMTQTLHATINPSFLNYDLKFYTSQVSEGKNQAAIFFVNSKGFTFYIGQNLQIQSQPYYFDLQAYPIPVQTTDVGNGFYIIDYQFVVQNGKTYLKNIGTPPIWDVAKHSFFRIDNYFGYGFVGQKNITHDKTILGKRQFQGLDTIGFGETFKLLNIQNLQQGIFKANLVLYGDQQGRSYQPGQYFQKINTIDTTKKFTIKSLQWCQKYVPLLKAPKFSLFQHNGYSTLSFGSSPIVLSGNIMNVGFNTGIKYLKSQWQYQTSINGTTSNQLKYFILQNDNQNSRFCVLVFRRNPHYLGFMYFQNNSYSYYVTANPNGVIWAQYKQYNSIQLTTPPPWGPFMVKSLGKCLNYDLRKLYFDTKNQQTTVIIKDEKVYCNNKLYQNLISFYSNQKKKCAIKSGNNFLQANTFWSQAQNTFDVQSVDLIVQSKSLIYKLKKFQIPSQKYYVDIDFPIQVSNMPLMAFTNSQQIQLFSPYYLEMTMTTIRDKGTSFLLNKKNSYNSFCVSFLVLQQTKLSANNYKMHCKVKVDGLTLSADQIIFIDLILVKSQGVQYDIQYPPTMFMPCKLLANHFVTGTMNLLNDAKNIYRMQDYNFTVGNDNQSWLFVSSTDYKYRIILVSHYKNTAVYGIASPLRRNIMYVQFSYIIQSNQMRQQGLL